MVLLASLTKGIEVRRSKIRLTIATPVDHRHPIPDVLALLRLLHGSILLLRVHLTSARLCINTTHHTMHHTVRRPHVWHNRHRP